MKFFLEAEVEVCRESLSLDTEVDSDPERKFVHTYLGCLFGPLKKSNIVKVPQDEIK